MRVTTSNKCERQDHTGFDEAGTVRMHHDWHWSLHVHAEHDVLAGVRIKLHPTFKQDEYALARQADGSFASPRFTGWGTFPVQLTLTLKDDHKHIITHELSFDRPITTVTHDVPWEPQQTEPLSTGSDGASDVGRVTLSESAAELVERLRETPSLRHGDPRFFHGRAWRATEGDAPRATWVSEARPRADHDDKPAWLTATEWEDSPDVLRRKLEMLATLLRASKKTVLYTGAGISVSAGIGQAAKGSAGKGKSWADAEPTPTHFAAGVLAKHQFAHGWVQQNHDGLPQKAAWPQERINEVHGSWFDPSNPVVKYSGSLKHELYTDMVELAETAELVLVMGTSLSGLNADQMALKAARRAGRGAGLGFVMLNLQQTEHDGAASLRINAKSDDVMRLLLPTLGLPPLPSQLPPAAAAFAATPSIVRVPYDERGVRLPEGTAARRQMWLDLRDGSAVKLTAGHNVQGAQQPGMMHIGATQPTRDPHTGAMRPPAEGVGRVVRRHEATCSFALDIEGVHMRLGLWWLEAATRGALEQLPIVNVVPRFE